METPEGHIHRFTSGFDACDDHYYSLLNVELGIIRENSLRQMSKRRNRKIQNKIFNHSSPSSSSDVGEENHIYEHPFSRPTTPFSISPSLRYVTPLDRVSTSSSHATHYSMPLLVESNQTSSPPPELMTPPHQSMTDDFTSNTTPMKPVSPVVTGRTETTEPSKRFTSTFFIHLKPVEPSPEPQPTNSQPTNPPTHQPDDPHSIDKLEKTVYEEKKIYRHTSTSSSCVVKNENTTSQTQFFRHNKK